MTCTASPGWFCSPLYNQPTICPENWYCPGGLNKAMRCPDNRWSAVGSVYPENCLEHNVEIAVIFVLFFMLLSLSVCIWLASWEWVERDRKPPLFPEPRYPVMFYDEQSFRSVNGHRCRDGLYNTAPSPYP